MAGTAREMAWFDRSEGDAAEQAAVDVRRLLAGYRALRRAVELADEVVARDPAVVDHRIGPVKGRVA
jgi:hypothetical protein